MSIEKFRADFPALRQQVGGRSPIYFDSACVTLKPQQVIAAERAYEERYPGCTRSVHAFGAQATEAVAQARKTLQKFLRAKKESEIIFTKNTTEGINMVAHGLAWQQGDVVVGTDKEHNSNLVPWLRLVDEERIERVMVPSRPDNTFDLQSFEQHMNRKVKLVALAHTSNLDGVTSPAKQIIRIVHDYGALVLLDAAQSVPHQTIDVRTLDADFLAFSGHKMLGPAGTGVLYGKEHLFEDLKPYSLGGDTVSRTTYDSYQLLAPPERFEAGLQNYSGIIGLGEAARYLMGIGMDTLHDHEMKINKIVDEAVRNAGGMVIGPPDPALRGGITSFVLKGLTIHETASLLNSNWAIMVRAGQHCVHSWFHAHGLEGSVRASLYLYNTPEEARAFGDALQEIAQLA